MNKATSMQEQGSLCDTGESSVISVVTPVYNMVDTVERTIRSVVEQDYPHVEYIVVDGGSTDGTVDVLRTYDASIAQWTSEPDDGLYDAMNKGIRHATGDIVGIINADDWYEPGAFAAIAEAVSVHPKAGVYYGDVLVELDGRPPFFHASKAKVNELSDFCFGIPVAHAAAFVRRSVYERYGVFDRRYQIVADFDLLARLVRHKVDFVHTGALLAHVQAGGLSDRLYAKGRREGLQSLRAHGASWDTLLVYALHYGTMALKHWLLQVMERWPVSEAFVRLVRRLKDHVRNRDPLGTATP